MLLGLLGGYGWALALHEPEAVCLPVPVAAVASLAVLPLQAPQPLFLRLKPRDRARVLAALAGLVILGFTLIALAWWGARFTRRYLKRPWPGGGRQRFSNISEFDWAGKPLYETNAEDNGDVDAEHGRDE
jgi:hypothetical protein